MTYDRSSLQPQETNKVGIPFTHACLFPASDLEKSYEDNERALEQKAKQLVELEAAVKELLQEISHKVTVYSTCMF